MSWIEKFHEIENSFSSLFEKKEVKIFKLSEEIKKHIKKVINSSIENTIDNYFSTKIKRMTHKDPEIFWKEKVEEVASEFVDKINKDPAPGNGEDCLEKIIKLEEKYLELNIEWEKYFCRGINSILYKYETYPEKLKHKKYQFIEKYKKRFPNLSLWEKNIA